LILYNNYSKTSMLSKAIRPNNKTIMKICMVS
jgi:hypothetical protein